MFRDSYQSLFGTGVFNSDGVCFRIIRFQLTSHTFLRGNVEVS